jgi:muramoyltetrapeptide carboxypeptidase LdcA involved in peptidoglycan recycling
MMNERNASPFVRPPRLRPGDTVAVLSASWGGPHAYPHVFEAGLDALRVRFGLRVRTYPTTRMSANALAADPRARAADVEAAFADDGIRGIVASIGGDDSARLLRHLDPELVRAHPKVLLGYSDTTTLLVFAHQLGLVTFHGPAVMAGIAQLAHFPAAEAHIRAVLFDPVPELDYRPYPAWTDGYRDWDEGHATEVDELRPHDGWRWLQGTGASTGRLFGGCFEVLEFLKGSRWWPTEAAWHDRVLFLETSEERPTVQAVQRWLFSYGVQGAFDRISALLVGRARGYDDDEKARLDEAILDTVVGQFGATDLTIVTNMDFGHTDPQWVLPLGARVGLDAEQRTFRLLEPAVV